MRCIKSLLLMACMSMPALFAQASERDVTYNLQEGIDTLKVRDYGTFALKTNLLEWATATINLGAEVTLAPKYSLELTGSVNPFKISSTKKWKHYQFTGEVRYWLDKSMQGHFFGIHAGGGRYNIGGIKVPFWGFKKDYRYEGWHVRAGLTYGYRWMLSRHWDLEGLLGLGVIHTSYDRYNCGNCPQYDGSSNKTFFAPTRLALNLVYTFGRQKPREVVYVQVPVTVHSVDTVVVDKTVVKVPTLEETYPFVHRLGTEAPKHRHLPVRYRLDDPVLYPDYSDNQKNLALILDAVNAVMTSDSVKLAKVDIVGFASPEGPYERNMWLGTHRAEALRDYLVEKDNRLQGTQIDITSGGEDWEGLRELVMKSDMVGKEDVIRIIDTASPEDRKVQLKALNGGRVYSSMLDVLYPQLRSACYIDVWYDMK